MSVAVEVGRFVHGQAVTVSGESVVDDRDRSTHPVVPVFRSGVSYLSHYTVRNIEFGETEFVAAVGITGVVVLPVGVSYGRSTVVHRLGVSERIRSRHVETESEVFLQQG